MTARLGPNALGLTLDQFRALLRGRRGAIKPFLLNQKRIAGIGNVYVQDPLFKVGIHPLRPINTLSDDEVAALWQALRETLQESIDHGGSAWELDLYGDKVFPNRGYVRPSPCVTFARFTAATAGVDQIPRYGVGVTSGINCSWH
jgi:formamidopyrimidine-DNA glycosylase